MDRLCHELFARASFPLNEGRSVCRRNAFESLDEPKHLLARSHNAFKTKLFIQPSVEFKVLSLEPDCLRGFFHSRP